MVTTQRSWEYTSYALKTFARHTKLVDGDRFYLIDNDQSFGSAPNWVIPCAELVQHDTPRSFSANMNLVMEHARRENADLYFLNNDLIFTEGWIEPLSDPAPRILSPLSNREVQYEAGGFQWKNVLVLPDYLTRPMVLKEVLQLHRAQCSGYRKVLSLPFFCVKVPYEVFSVVGPLDEGFGVGGAEDNDYCLRAVEAGFSVEYAMSSYILHFSGKSTWAGGESTRETDERVMKYRAHFQLKWGPKLRQLIIDEDSSVIAASPDARAAVESGNLRALVEILKQTS